jgi:hypothetical protein
VGRASAADIGGSFRVEVSNPVVLVLAGGRARLFPAPEADGRRPRRSALFKRLGWEGKGPCPGFSPAQGRRRVFRAGRPLTG